MIRRGTQRYILFQALDRMGSTLQSCTTKDPGLGSFLCPVLVGRYTFVVPEYVVNITNATYKKLSISEDDWAAVVDHLRTHCMWPDRNLHDTDYMRYADWEIIMESPEYGDRLERSMSVLHCMCPGLLEKGDDGVILAQRLFGDHFDQKPSMGRARGLLGKMSKRDYVFLHFALISAFMMDATPISRPGHRVDVLTGYFMRDLKYEEPTRGFGY